MHHMMDITDEELEVLGKLLNTELAEGKTELRHTSNRRFRQTVQHRMDIEQALLEKIGRISPAMASGSYSTETTTATATATEPLITPAPDTKTE